MKRLLLLTLFLAGCETQYVQAPPSVRLLPPQTSPPPMFEEIRPSLTPVPDTRWQKPLGEPEQLPAPRLEPRKLAFEVMT